MFNLGIQAEKTHRKPYIPMLKENNVRTGFFEHGEFVAFRGASPDYLQPVATISMRELFASIQGPPRTTRGRLLFLMANCWKRFRSNGSGARLRRSPDNPLPCFVLLFFTANGSQSKIFGMPGIKHVKQRDLPPRYSMTSGVRQLGTWFAPVFMKEWR